MTNNPQLDEFAEITAYDFGDAEADAEERDPDYAALVLGALFFWDVTRGTWVNRSSGQALDVQGYYRYIDILASSQKVRMGAMYRAFLRGAINGGQMFDVMARELRRVHLQSAAMGVGGFDRLAADDLQRVGSFLRDELGYLRGWVNDTTVERITEAEARRRLDMYSNHVQSTFFEAHTEAKRSAGYTEMRRHAVNDHVTCSDCAGYDARGWQPIGTLPAPGIACQCLSNCRCEIEYR